MKQLEIYYNDLNKKAKKEYLNFVEAETEDDLNHEYCPIFILECEPETE